MPGEFPASDAGSEPVHLSTSSPQSLHRAVYARRAEYTRPHRIRVKVGTWNVAACPGTDKDLASWFVSGEGIDTRLAALDLSHNSAVETQPSATSQGHAKASVRVLGEDKIGLYVLGLQEVVNLNPVTQYVYAESNPTEKWRMALEAALPKGYQFLASEQMSGLLLLLYASPEVAPSVGNVSTRSVGTGVGGWFGNKGASVARIVLGETTKIAFVNSHLSSGNDAASLERRCWDANTIMDRTRFDPITRAGDMDDSNQDKIGDEDFAFWFGDLNFRLDGIPGDDIRRLLTLHTKGEYDLNRPKKDASLDGEGIIVMRSSTSSDDQTDGGSATTRSTKQSDDDSSSISLPDPDDFEPDAHDDPASLQTTLDSLLPHDQLLRLRREKKLFHEGWREGPITFLPSYKYDVGTVGLFDSSEKRRAPSWCDRILYRTKRDKDQHQRKIKEEEEARKRDEEMKAQGIDHAADDDEVLFDYDPDNDGDAQPSGKPGLDYDEYDEGGNDAGEATATSDNAADELHLDLYTSHQRIMSSDHKPLVAMFTLDYDAVVRDLKAKIHTEVARELDRAENEGRPAITIVMDGHGRESGDESVDFGDISYLKKQTASLTIANTGRVPATFNFVERPTSTSAEASKHPQWLTTSFSRPGMSQDSDEPIDLGKEVTLEPGETINAVLQVLVDKIPHARMLNDGHERLEEVLVLRLTDGRDHFIPVHGTWTPTCIGRSIDELIRVPDGGLRALVKTLMEKKNGKQHVGSIPYDLVVRNSAPKEIFKLTEALDVLIERTLADEQMLESCQIPREKAGWPFEDFAAGSHSEHLPNVIDVLDNDKPVTDAFSPDVPAMMRLETVAEALLLFLQGLTDGVISMPLWSKIEQAHIQSLGQSQNASTALTLGTASAEDDRTAILDILGNAPNHNICFVFLAATLAKVISELAPLTKFELDALKDPTSAGGRVGGISGAIGRRSMSFRRNTGITTTGKGTAVADAIAALEKRKLREKRVAEIFGKVICRTPIPAKDKERKVVEEKARVVVELFLRRREDE